MCRKCVFGPQLDIFTTFLKTKMLAMATHCPPGAKNRDNHEYEVEGLQKVINGLGCLIRGGDAKLYREGLTQVIEAVDRHITAGRIPEHLREEMYASRAELLVLLSRCDDIDESLDLPDILPMGRVDKGMVN